MAKEKNRMSKKIGRVFVVFMTSEVITNYPYANFPALAYLAYFHESKSHVFQLIVIFRAFKFTLSPT